jgi:hypothetical protein
MECFWRLYSHWEPYGYRYQQDPAIFHVHFYPDDGLPYHPLHDIGFLEKYAQVYLGREEESLVLLVNGQW